MLHKKSNSVRIPERQSVKYDLAIAPCDITEPVGGSQTDKIIISSLGQKNTIVSGLRARHLQTSASMFFCNKKKFTCFSASKEYVKHFQMLQYDILRRA